MLDVDPEWILAGNGSDDLLTMLMRAVAAPDRPVAYPVPTYVLYRTLAAMQEAPVVETPFDDAYALPVDALARAAAALTIVANPNSPSGTAAPLDALEALAARLGGVLVIDEAYVEFADRSALDLVRRSDRVVVLRTLSKSHGLAGLRLGFAVAQPPLLEGLAKVKDSYNVDAVAARVGAAAIADVSYTRAQVARIRDARRRLGAALADLGIPGLAQPGQLRARPPPDGNARRLYEGLRSRDILVRYFDEPRLADALRITVGTEAQNARLTAALAALMRPS